MGKNRCRVCESRKARVCDECLEEMRVIDPPPWTPFQEAHVDFEDPTQALAFEGCKVYRNSRYQVALRDCGNGLFGPMVHLSIKRIDRLPVRDWRDLQRIKNELVGENAEGIEIFPDESRCVDTANQYHLWVFPEYRFPFGFSGRLVTEGGFKGAKQRVFEDPKAKPAHSRKEFERSARETRVNHVMTRFIAGEVTEDQVVEKLKELCEGDRDLFDRLSSQVESMVIALNSLNHRLYGLVFGPWEKEESK